jgi:hypothetical protein
MIDSRVNGRSLEGEIMHISNRLLAAAAIAALALAALPGRAAEQAVPQAATWQAHHATLIYEPYTSQYTCDGLRSKVREIFLFLGARRDLKIIASGCGPSEFPMGAASVSVDFSTLAAAPGAAPSSVVQGYWTPTRVMPGWPNFIDAGDCELIAQMRKVLTDDFAWQNLDYRVLCTPHDVSVDSFKLQGLVLKTNRGAS